MDIGRSSDLGERYYAYVNGSIDWPAFAADAQYDESLVNVLGLAGGQRQKSANHNTAFITLKAAAARASRRQSSAVNSLDHATKAFAHRPDETDLLDVIVHMTGYVAERFPRGNRKLIEKGMRAVIRYSENR